MKLCAEFKQYTDHRTVLSNGITWFISHYGIARLWKTSDTDRQKLTQDYQPNIPSAFQLNA